MQTGPEDKGKTLYNSSKSLELLDFFIVLMMDWMLFSEENNNFLRAIISHDPKKEVLKVLETHQKLEFSRTEGFWFINTLFLYYLFLLRHPCKDELSYVSGIPGAKLWEIRGRINQILPLFAWFIEQSSSLPKGMRTSRIRVSGKDISILVKKKVGRSGKTPPPKAGRPSTYGIRRKEIKKFLEGKEEKWKEKINSDPILVKMVYIFFLQTFEEVILEAYDQAVSNFEVFSGQFKKFISRFQRLLDYYPEWSKEFFKKVHASFKIDQRRLNEPLPSLGDRLKERRKEVNIMNERQFFLKLIKPSWGRISKYSGKICQLIEGVSRELDPHYPPFFFES